MLFLLKRRLTSALAATALLSGVGFCIRATFGGGPDFNITFSNALLGSCLFVVMLLSDGMLYALFSFGCGQSYRDRHRELASLFAGQKIGTMLGGALMAGLGEELIFRGLASGPLYLVLAALVFGLLHHIRWSLWPFTVWAGYQGCLLALGVSWTGSLFAAMIAHFLHDLAGFLLFRRLNC
jgi:membrane protease YdiL (CAAX protease family)